MTGSFRVPQNFIAEDCQSSEVSWSRSSGKHCHLSAVDGEMNTDAVVECLGKITEDSEGPNAESKSKRWPCWTRSKPLNWSREKLSRLLTDSKGYSPTPAKDNGPI